jgi:hypothetical protein
LNSRGLAMSLSAPHDYFPSCPRPESHRILERLR